MRYLREGLMVTPWLESVPWHYREQSSPPQGAGRVARRAWSRIGVRALAVMHLTGNKFISSCTGLGPSDGAEQELSLAGLKPAEQVRCCSEQRALPTSAPVPALGGKVADNSISNHKVMVFLLHKHLHLGFAFAV